MSTTQVPVPSEVELTIVKQRFGLAEVQLGDAQLAASEKVAQLYNRKPRCETRSVSLANTRKAFSLVICEYKPEAVSLNDAPIVRVVTYFLDEILIRLDVDAEGDATSFASVESSLETDWPDARQRPLNATDRVETVWLSGADELSLSHLEAASMIEYRIRDTRLADKLPWLFE
ncbi:MAG: hypothetical protein V3U65_17845 [Granulosicoccaceae bacterium]